MARPFFFGNYFVLTGYGFRKQGSFTRVVLTPSQQIRRHISILLVNCPYFLTISTTPDLKPAILASLPTKFQKKSALLQPSRQVSQDNRFSQLCQHA
jgi:hypothetical protein